MTEERQFSIDEQVKIVVGCNRGKFGKIKEFSHASLGIGYNLFIQGMFPCKYMYYEDEIRKLPKDRWIEGW